MVHRKLGRPAPHRMSLLRNLTSSLFELESIVTTHAKAKEVQSFAERIITKARNATPTTKKDVMANLMRDVYRPNIIFPKLFGELAARYKTRSGGYVRVLKLENRLGDNAPQSIIELVDGPKDMRVAMTARTVARYELEGVPLNPITQRNVQKICHDEAQTRRFRDEVEFMKAKFYTEEKRKLLPPVAEFCPKTRAPIRIVSQSPGAHE